MAVPVVLIESRTEFALGTIIFILRWFARWKTVGISKWYYDDWFSICAWCWYLVLIVMVEYLGKLLPLQEQIGEISNSSVLLAVVGAAAGFTEEQREALDPTTRASYVKGGKAMFASFYCFICLVWGLKATLLGFYSRLT